MGESYIPSRDSEVDAWVENFKTKIAASPTTYSLTSSDATAITAAYTSWHTAYLAATNPTTRSHTTVNAKNVQKTNVLSVVRGYAATIRANRAVSDDLKIGLGLHVRSGGPTPIPPPATYPLLTMASFNMGTLELHAADETSPDRRARPNGTAGLLLFSTTGTSGATDPVNLEFEAFLTKPKFETTFSSGDAGKTVTYFGRWTNGKGQLGPWSAPLPVRIAA